jgi:hypothetical protein
LSGDWDVGAGDAALLAGTGTGATLRDVVCAAHAMRSSVAATAVKIERADMCRSRGERRAEAARSESGAS